MILILIDLAFAYGISLIARDTLSRDSQIPIAIISFALLLFATGAV